MGNLSRIGVSIDSELLRRFDAYITEKAMRTGPRPSAT